MPDFVSKRTLKKKTKQKDGAQTVTLKTGDQHPPPKRKRKGQRQQTA